MSESLSSKLEDFIWQDEGNGIADVISETNTKVANGSIEYKILLDDRLGTPYFYECMKLALNVIKSFEVEELEE